MIDGNMLPIAPRLLIIVYALIQYFEMVKLSTKFKYACIYASHEEKVKVKNSYIRGNTFSISLFMTIGIKKKESNSNFSLECVLNHAFLTNKNTLCTGHLYPRLPRGRGFRGHSGA